MVRAALRASGFELESGFVTGKERVVLEIAGFEALQPIADERANAVDAEVVVEVGIFLEIGVGQFEQCGGGTEAVFLQVDERAGELNEPFIKGIIGAGALGEPEFFQDIVRLKIEPAIEAFKVAEVMGVKIASFELLDQFRDGAAFFAHDSERIENGGQGAGKINR